MAKFAFPVIESDFHPFRRWLKARDPDAVLVFEPADSDALWMVTVTTSKAYIARSSERRWRAS